MQSKVHLLVCRKGGKLSINKKQKKESLNDSPDITTEVFAGTNLSSAAAVAGLRDVKCATTGSVSFW